jgi:GMP synthase-like glutamine amidotransferase
MRVLSVIHGPTVRSELFGDLILAEGHELIEWEIGSEPRPDARVDAALVLGGHQNVGEEGTYPWLDEEYELLRGFVRSETPLFGICLGAQTLAHALGASVTQLPAQQAGFVEVELTEAGAADPVLGVLPDRFEALVGNQYAFEVPDAGVTLASSAIQPQGFRVGKQAWAVQFHPEARRDQVLDWWQTDGLELPAPLPELRRELDAKIADWHDLGGALCRAFLAAAA